MPKPMSPDDEYAAAFNDDPNAVQAEEGPQGDVGGIDPTEAIEESNETNAEGVGAMPPAAPDAGVAEAATEAPPTEAIEEVTEAVASGDMTLDQAMKTLSEDFGPEFVSLLRVLMKAEAAEAVKPVATTVDDVIAHIADSRQRAHFEAIADAHPDFMDVANSDAMKAYLDGLPEDQKSEAEAVIKGGSAKKIIALLDAVKAASKTEPPADKGEQQNESAMDAAEGVRSGGLRIPKQPKVSDDYAKAWDQF